MVGEIYSTLLLLKEKLKLIPVEDLPDYLDNYQLDPDIIRLKDQISLRTNYQIANMTHQDDKTPFLSNRIDYLNVYEDDEAYFSAGVFFLPKGHSLPLHDHKNMLVITKILSGKVMINSYERKNPLNTSTTKFEINFIGTQTLREGDVDILTPKMKNFHDLIALEDVALFDVLLPDYDKLEGCNYYEPFKKKGKLYLKLL